MISTFANFFFDNISFKCSFYYDNNSNDCTKSDFVVLEWKFRKWKAIILMHTGIIFYLNMIYINDTTFLMDYFFERLDFFKREDSSSLLLLWNHHNIYCPQLWVAWKHFFLSSWWIIVLGKQTRAWCWNNNRKTYG